MKNALIVLSIALLCNLKLSGQEAVSSSGSFDNNATGSMSWTLGECITETFTTSQTKLTQGIQQPNLIVTLIIELPLNYSIIAFPNPAKDIVKLKIGKAKVEGMEYLLMDVNGKVLENKLIQSDETAIPFTLLLPSTYFIKIIDAGKEVKTFKIIKL